MKVSHLFLLILFFSLLSFSSNLFSQEMTFCKRVFGNGYPKDATDVLIISPNGGAIDVLITDLFSTTRVLYVVNYEGKFDFDYNQDTNLRWTWCYHRMYFKKAGHYLITAYDDHHRYIVSGNLIVKYAE